MKNLNMKKTIAALIALMMVLVCIAAAAEEKGPDSEATKLFSSRWVSTGGGIRVDIWNNDGIWAVKVDKNYGSEIWNYTCVYDEEQNTLVSVESGENTKTVMSLDENNNETGSEIADGAAKASFTLDENGSLVWKDEKEGAGDGVAFGKIGWFENDYYCGNYTMSCFWDVEEPAEGEIYSGYKVTITLEDETGVTEWYFPCFYNPETNTLDSLFGTREFKPADSEAYEIVYEDGEASFSMNEEGCVLWDDKKDNAGEGLVFELSNG